LPSLTMYAYGTSDTGTGSLLYQDWQRFAISCGIFCCTVLKNRSAHALQSDRPRRAFAKIRSRIVQTLNSPQRVRFGVSLDAVVLSGSFEQPVEGLSLL